MFSIPSSNWFTNRKNKPNPRRHVDSLCHTLWQELGKMPSCSEVLVQQQLSGELEMTPFEALYGRRCRTPLSWSEVGERVVFGPDLVTEAEEKVRVIQANLKAAQSRQKIYFDKRKKPLQFKVGDHVYLRVSPTKGHNGLDKRKISSSVRWSQWNQQNLWTCGL
jgi:hypothetical protein